MVSIQVKMYVYGFLSGPAFKHSILACNHVLLLQGGTSVP